MKTDTRVVAIDFEGTGLDYWSPNYRVVSLATVHYEHGDMPVSWFSNQPEQIREKLLQLSQNGDLIIAHNIAYEYGVVITQFPDIQLNWYADTMRLCQMRGGWGKTIEKQLRFGLEACVTRLLPKECHEHKNEADQWILENIRISEVKRIPCRKKNVKIFGVRERKVKKSEVGKFRKDLPVDILRRYNILDSLQCLRLFWSCYDWFLKERIDWRIDHKIWLPVVLELTKAKIRGVRIARKSLERYIPVLEEKARGVEEKFRAEVGEVLEAFEKQHGPFNYNSTAQLIKLFVDTMGIEPKLWTEPKKNLKTGLTSAPKPSTRAAHLRQFGKAGEVLSQRKKVLKVIEHCQKVLDVSAVDGLWHPDLKGCGTSTGRFAGGGGLNIQGLARRDKGLMSSFRAPDKKVFISRDLSSGEPTATTHFSQDEHYRACIFDLIGKPPYWKETLAGSVLMCDSIYITGMSFDPAYKDRVRQAWDTTYEGKTFAEKWVEDSDFFKKGVFKEEYKVAKAKVLGLGYGMGPKKLVRVCRDNGTPSTLEACRGFYKNYWAFFNGLKQLSDKCAEAVQKRGHIVNTFGYVNHPEPHKAFNALIQSSISGIINVSIQMTTELAPYAELVTVIHDEDIFCIPEDKVEHFREISKQVEEQLNQLLKWSVRVRLGFAVGRDLYSAK
jgi:DNA polymerase I-like protein with 3'-5' exonuclease and polymerase domains